MTHSTDHENADIKSGKAAGHRLTGIRTSYLWALLFSGVIGLWLLSGEIVIGGQKSDNEVSVSEGMATATGAQASPKKLFRVQVRTQAARPRDASLVLRGRTEADAKVSVMSETSGVVEAMPVKKGTFVEKGTVLCKLDKAARAATVAQFKAALEKARADSQASSKLVKRGYAGKLKVTTDQAQLDAARAQYDLAKLDLERTQIKAPFSGVVEEQPAKVGDYMVAGFGSRMACAVMVDIDPLIVVAAVSERNISKLQEGLEAKVKLVTGENVQGKIRYIATSADPKTRTFRVEIAVSNPKWKLRDGVTADILIPLKPEPAHYFTPAILVLNDAGQIGVRLVDDNNKVAFNRVHILANDAEGVWVAGLPQSIRLITVGQEYVTEGQEVLPSEEASYGSIEVAPKSATIR